VKLELVVGVVVDDDLVVEHDQEIHSTKMAGENLRRVVGFKKRLTDFAIPD